MLKEAHGKVGRVCNGSPHYVEVTAQVHEEQDRSVMRGYQIFAS